MDVTPSFLPWPLDLLEVKERARELEEKENSVRITGNSVPARLRKRIQDLC